MLCMETEREKWDQELCPYPRVSKDNILTGYQELKHLEALPNFKTFEEYAIVELFHCLQWAHNAMAETATHLTFLSVHFNQNDFPLY